MLYIRGAGRSGYNDPRRRIMRHFVLFELSSGKLAHITQLVYATGTKVANLDHAPARDNKGPRMGKGRTGKIEK